MTQWQEIDEFPEYSISNHGDVVNNLTGRPLKPIQNQQGIFYVGLTQEKMRINRSVALLVARIYVPQKWEIWDSVIHKDGDRANFDANNLEWRPRWYAIKYHQQFLSVDPVRVIVPIRNLDTGETFPNSWPATIKYGILGSDIFRSTREGVEVFYTGHHYEIIR